ncbi:hypothetical protein PLESTF_001173000 [Pleodorina starrii]|nr:hypothetical protein PLESTF_001173000 [Pleodorina starrii]
MHRRPMGKAEEESDRLTMGPHWSLPVAASKKLGSGAAVQEPGDAGGGNYVGRSGQHLSSQQSLGGVAARGQTGPAVAARPPASRRRPMLGPAGNGRGMSPESEEAALGLGAYGRSVDEGYGRAGRRFEHGEDDEGGISQPVQGARAEPSGASPERTSRRIHFSQNVNDVDEDDYDYYGGGAVAPPLATRPSRPLVRGMKRPSAGVQDDGGDEEIAPEEQVMPSRAPRRPQYNGKPTATSVSGGSLFRRSLGYEQDLEADPEEPEEELLEPTPMPPRYGRSLTTGGSVDRGAAAPRRPLLREIVPDGSQHHSVNLSRKFIRPPPASFADDVMMTSSAPRRQVHSEASTPYEGMSPHWHGPKQQQMPKQQRRSADVGGSGGMYYDSVGQGGEENAADEPPLMRRSRKGAVAESTAVDVALNPMAVPRESVLRRPDVAVTDVSSNDDSAALVVPGDLALNWLEMEAQFREALEGPAASSQAAVSSSAFAAATSSTHLGRDNSPQAPTAARPLQANRSLAAVLSDAGDADSASHPRSGENSGMVPMVSLRARSVKAPPPAAASGDYDPAALTRQQHLEGQLSGSISLERQLQQPRRMQRPLGASSLRSPADAAVALLPEALSKMVDEDRAAGIAATSSGTSSPLNRVMRFLSNPRLGGPSLRPSSTDDVSPLDGRPGPSSNDIPPSSPGAAGGSGQGVQAATWGQPAGRTSMPSPGRLASSRVAPGRESTRLMRSTASVSPHVSANISQAVAPLRRPLVRARLDGNAEGADREGSGGSPGNPAGPVAEATETPDSTDEQITLPICDPRLLYDVANSPIGSTPRQGSAYTAADDGDTSKKGPDAVGGNGDGDDDGQLADGTRTDRHSVPGMPVVVADAAAIPCSPRSPPQVHASAPQIYMGDTVTDGEEQANLYDPEDDGRNYSRTRKAKSSSGGHGVGCGDAADGGNGSGSTAVWWSADGPLEVFPQGQQRPVAEGREAGAFRLRNDAFTEVAPSEVDKKMLKLYPGKQAPMYRMHYLPDCWTVRLSIAPSIGFLARFEFLFEDAIGFRDRQYGRETKMILCAHCFNVSHKALCAAAFGYFGSQHRSTLQLGLVCTLQTLMVVYLGIWRPYADWKLLMMEVICHGGMMVLLCCAFVLINSTPNNRAPTTFLMLACFALVSLSIILYGFYNVCCTIKGVLGAVSAWCLSKMRKAPKNVDTAAATKKLTSADNEDDDNDAGYRRNGSGDNYHEGNTDAAVGRVRSQNSVARAGAGRARMSAAVRAIETAPGDCGGGDGATESAVRAAWRSGRVAGGAGRAPAEYGEPQGPPPVMRRPRGSSGMKARM